MRRIGWIAVLLWLVWPGTAALARIALRVGIHPGFGRLAVIPPGKLPYALTRNGDVLHLRMPGGGGFGAPNRLPTNVTAITPTADELAIALAPGVLARAWRQGNTLLLDLYDPGSVPAADRLAAETLPPAAPPAKAAPAAKPSKPSATPAAMPAAMPAAQPAAQPTSLATSLPPPVPAPRIVPSNEAALDPGPVATGLAPAPVSPTGLMATALPDGALFPYPADAGAASFRRGDWALLVFDQPKPLDLSALHDDPPFAGARLTLLPDATVLALPLPADRALAFERRREGWAVHVVDSSQAGPGALRPQGVGGVVTIAAAAPGSVVAVEDPETGGKLLVGTLRQGGPGLALGYRSPEFALLPSWLGVAVDPRSDRLGLRAVKAGFRLAADSGPPLATALDSGGMAALEEAGHLTRDFDFAPLPTAELRARLREQEAAEAAAPELGRFADRVAVAQTMLSLGLDREALAMLRWAIAEEPESAGDGNVRELAAMAGWLAGVADTGIQAPAPPSSDETVLWHALTGGDGNAAQAQAQAQTEAEAIAPRWRLLLGYPAPLRHRLLAAAAERLESARRLEPLAALLAASQDPALALVRARSLRDSGKPAPALAAFDGLARSRDRWIASNAVRDAVELRLASHAVNARQAASLLDRHLYDWRGDETELASRLRLAALRAEASDPRAAMAVLQETERLFPDRRDRVREAERAVVAGLIKPGAASKVDPIDLVAIAEQSAGLLTETEAGSALAAALVDRLLALDLPDRAAPILERMVAGASPGPARAALGLRLAALRLERGDAAGARAALSDTDVPGLDAGLAGQRAVVLARALAGTGDVAGALAALAPVDTEESLTLQAKLRSDTHDWRGAEQALRALAKTRIPPGRAPLNDAQADLLLQLAGAASNAQDMEGMQELRTEQAARLPPGPKADLFRVLTASPVRATADLPRAASESAAARQAIAGLEPH